MILFRAALAGGIAIAWEERLSLGEIGRILGRITGEGRILGRITKEGKKVRARKSKL